MGAQAKPFSKTKTDAALFTRMRAISSMYLNREIGSSNSSDPLADKLAHLQTDKWIANEKFFVYNPFYLLYCHRNVLINPLKKQDLVGVGGGKFSSIDNLNRSISIKETESITFQNRKRQAQMCSPVNSAK